MSAWILAFIIVLFFEGAMIGIAPKTWKRTIIELVKLPDHSLRKVGLSMAGVALVLLVLFKTTGS
ncbi:DUF2065 domain-containing protein [Suttonella sp. R2A3]|uniref:DUF2065 domain-containing protein n=1 Tax=Suttonella sp. R2A3 TaxID=2908648 RepID=UPI001F3A4156|nr:DUF2065 domain-containing protein [Suttonella sp. R2A3]UJF24897.1 DUF2065 domain-containing protein [Suttonella sp. R2A3]